MKRRSFIKSGIAALAGLAIGESIRLFAGERVEFPPLPPRKKSATGRAKSPNNYRNAAKITGVCLNCSTVCGIVGHVIEGKLVKISGNPEDPNNGKTLCAKGQSGVTIGTYPERILYPLRRVGKRGEGLWKRITWDEAYQELASRVRACVDAGKPEEVAIHIGRSRIAGEMGRFLDAIGSPVLLNHRALCSANKRAANYSFLGDTDWETVDVANSKYILNFGANFYEAHQGHIHVLKRAIQGRFDNGAKLVTFDVRLSNTAGRSDEWHAPFPGTEGAIALAMARTMFKSGEYDKAFIQTWTNASPEELSTFLERYTPAFAAKESGLKAEDIERIAVEFARARPRCVAFTNRGSHAHYNGFNNDRAVLLLNALAGNLGKPGGYCYGESEKVDPLKFPPPEPQPSKVKIRTDLEDPPEWPLANFWQKMKVGQIVYDYIEKKRALIQVYLTYTLESPTTWPEGRSLAVKVLKDEALIPFHACSDVVYSETAHYSDMILPDATYMERWGLDTRNNHELLPYISLRQPIVPPPAECISFADVLFEIGRRQKPEIARFFAFKNHEEYVRHQCKNIPKGDCADGFEFMKKHGVWVDSSQPKTYELYKRPLSTKALEGSRIDEKSSLVMRKDALTGKDEAIGVVVDGAPLRGLKTVSRKFEIQSRTVAEQSRKVGGSDDGWPHYVPIPAHKDLPAERFILTSFKWNVHTQGRTASQKYLSEIVHDNPMWINAGVAETLKIKSGDIVEITTYRPKGNTYRPTGEKLGSARIRAFVTEGIHPRVLAVSNSLGKLFGGRAAQALHGIRPKGEGFDERVLPEDAQLAETLWWDSKEGGRGGGFNINEILPIQPAPLTGMQAWFDTVCTLRKV